MYCNECGTKITEGEKFCSNCGKKVTKNKSIIKILLKVLGIIISLILAFAIGIGIFFGGAKIKNIFNPNKNNMTMELKDNKKKDVYINEEDLKAKTNNLMSSISHHYPNAKINQVNEIKLIYNYKENIIEYVYLFVNLDRYYMIVRSSGSPFGIASVKASLSRNGVYTDPWKETNGDNDLIFDINNLPPNCGLLTEENNEILVKIKNELNKGRNNTFYWTKKVY